MNHIHRHFHTTHSVSTSYSHGYPGGFSNGNCNGMVGGPPQTAYNPAFSQNSSQLSSQARMMMGVMGMMAQLMGGPFAELMNLMGIGAGQGCQQGGPQMHQMPYAHPGFGEPKLGPEAYAAETMMADMSDYNARRAQEAALNIMRSGFAPAPTTNFAPSTERVQEYNDTPPLPTKVDLPAPASYDESNPPLPTLVDISGISDKASAPIPTAIGWG